MKRFLVTAALAAILTQPAFAGPVTDFEAGFRTMYGTYRAALFTTNSGDAAKAAKAVAALSNKWTAITADYGDNAPPHYADDPEWSATLAAITGDIAKAGAEVGTGELGAAHETLEGVRDEIGGLHARNGVELFSDRMNAYHAAMEEVLAIDLSGIDAAKARTLLEHAAVLSYLAGDVLATPPAEANGNAAYAKLAKGFRGSVDAFLTAARSGDPAAIRAAAGNLKGPYSKFFLNFG